MSKKIEIPQEELYQKYIVENLSRKECADFFGVSETLVKTRTKQFGFQKSKEQISELLSKSQKIILDKEQLYELYIIRNLTLCECAKILKTQPHNVKRRLKEFKIKKPKDKFKEVHRIHANQTLKSLERRQSTLLNKYGVDNVSKVSNIQSKKEKTTREHYGVSNPFQSTKIKEKISDNIMKKYGVPYSCMREECRKFSGNNSLPNQKFGKILDNFHIDYEREFPLESFSYDFKIGNYLFEVNPSAFHNSTFSPVGSPKNRFYHFDKSSVAKQYGYRCIHIFDWDDPEKIVKLFAVPKQKVYARNCTIKEVSVQETKMFLNENHLQGYAKDSIRLGLYEGDELVEIMTFGKPRYNKNYEYELVRLCSKKNVVGGTEKILKEFVKKYNPQNIISYCDLAKFDGETYHKLGFEVLVKPQPSKHWFNLKTKEHITDNLLRQKGFDQLFKTNYGKGTNNEELMREHGFVEIYDCGQLTFVKHF